MRAASRTIVIKLTRAIIAKAKGIMNRRIATAITLITLFASACATVPPPPQWSVTATSSEDEYLPYMKRGDAIISGQAFLSQQGGGVVKAAGREVTLDPATSLGNEWWSKAGKLWAQKSVIPPSSNFLKARKTTIADADGRFKFEELPPGKYYVRTEITWEIGNYQPTQGGLVGKQIEVEKGEESEIILNAYTD